MARGRVYQPGKRVPGEKNTGIIATAAGTFEAFVSYAGKRYTAGTWKTIEEARAARDARRLELEGGGTATSLREQRTSFAEFFDTTFLPEAYNPPTNPKRPSTLRSTMSRYAVYLAPYFGHRALIHITAQTIGTFITKLGTGVFTASEIVEREVHGTIRRFRPRRTATPSAKTQREVLILLRSILDEALRRRYIPVNPFPPKAIPRLRVDAPKKRKTPLSSATILKLVATISSPKHRMIAAVLAYTGLRLGEALALQWGDIDVRRGYLSVERSADAKTRVVGPPKTPHSIREVPLDPALSKMLQAYRASLRRVPAAGDWVFPSERQRAADAGTPPIIDQRVFTQRYFDVARKKVTTAHITPHTLRHLWCSTMVTKFPVADVSAWAGHHSPSFTYDRYVRPLERTTKGSPITTSIYTTKG